MDAGQSSLWKTIIFPPLFALLLYLLVIHIVVPLYQRIRSRHHVSFSSSFCAPLPSWLSLPPPLDQLQLSSRQRNSRASSGASLLGDEELEEGLLVIRPRQDAARVDNGERRLSRELEGGFRDESDDSDDSTDFDSDSD